MNENNNKTTNFVVFCLEAYKREKKLEARIVADQFAEYSVIEYLVENYDLLHTLGERALVEDIEKFLTMRK